MVFMGSGKIETALIAYLYLIIRTMRRAHLIRFSTEKVKSRLGKSRIPFVWYRFLV